MSDERHPALAPTLTPEQARDLTDRIKVMVDGSWHLIKQAYNSRAWAALGYSSWDDYCTPSKSAKDNHRWLRRPVTGGLMSSASVPARPSMMAPQKGVTMAAHRIRVQGGQQEIHLRAGSYTATNLEAIVDATRARLERVRAELKELARRDEHSPRPDGYPTSSLGGGSSGGDTANPTLTAAQRLVEGVGLADPVRDHTVNVVHWLLTAEKAALTAEAIAREIDDLGRASGPS